MKDGFSLIEMLAVILILALLATVLIPSVVDKVEGARYTLAKTDVTTLDEAVVSFQLDQGRLPNSLDELVAKPADAKRYPENGYLDGLRVVPVDPWDNRYIYKTPGADGRRYVILCHARDGREGGEGWDEDIDCWRIRERR